MFIAWLIMNGLSSWLRAEARDPGRCTALLPLPLYHCLLPSLRGRAEANGHRGRGMPDVTSRTQQVPTRRITAASGSATNVVFGKLAPKNGIKEKVLGQICHWKGGVQNTLVLITQSGVTHSLISSHWAINSTKAAATNFCGAVADDRWVSMQPQVQDSHLSSWPLLL